MLKHNKPNFLIVGAAKSGTTSLSKYLLMHNDIFIPKKKELRFFIRDIILKTNPNDPILKDILNSSVLDQEEYFDLFNVNEKLCGEASVHYLFHYEEAIPNILKQVGDIPIIIMLRNPVSRAISNYEFLYRIHNSSFEKELEREEERIKMGYNSFWFYKSLGFYSSQVRAYLENFSNVKIVIFEEFAQETEKQMFEIYKFLGVDPLSSTYEIFNESIRYTFIAEYLNKIGVIQYANSIIPESVRLNLIKIFSPIIYSKNKAKYPEALIKELYNSYSGEIKILESIIKKDLSIWKNETVYNKIK